MARLPNPRIRERLRDQAVDYVLSHGSGKPHASPLGEGSSDQRSYAYLPLWLAGGLMRGGPRASA